MTASTTNTYVQQGSVITDDAGNTWRIINGQVVVNGVVDQTTGRVVALAYENGLVWQMNTDRLWWAKGSPTGIWSPTYGTHTSPLVGFATSSNSVMGVIAAAQGAVITDADNDHWSILNGQITVNGVVDPTTANVVALAYEHGSIWQLNSAGHWYSKTNAADTWSAPTTLSPVQPNPTSISEILLPAGYTTLAPGQDNSDIFVFGGVNSPFDKTLPTLAFLQNPVSVVSQLVVAGISASSGVAAVSHFGSVSQGGNLEVDNGIQISEGRLTDTMAPGQSLVLGGPSNINNNGSLYVGTSSGVNVELNSTLTMGSLGTNILYLNDVNLSGGQILQNGENDTTYVGGVPPNGSDGSVHGTTFIINGGILDIAWPGGFGGTIGSNIGSSIGTFGVVEIENAMAVARATFDTTTGMMSLLNATGADLGDFHFAGDASGLVLNLHSVNGGVVLAINDHPSASQGNISLAFHK